jgi:hypothetical protein
MRAKVHAFGPYDSGKRLHATSLVLTRHGPKNVDDR